MARIAFILLITLPVCLLGQTVERAAGLRLGHSAGVAYKKFTTEEEAFDLLVSGRNEGTQFTALYEFYKPLEVSFDENFYFYYGVGGHLGYEKYDGLRKVLVSDDPLKFVFEEKNYFVMGVDLIAGVEYRYLSVPMTIAFELKPYFNFIGMRYTRSQFWDAGLSIKYVF